MSAAPPSDWFDTDPASAPEPLPASLHALAQQLATSGVTRRTALLWLAPATYAAGPQWAAYSLGLRPRHLGREVLAACEAAGTQRVPASSTALFQQLRAVHTSSGPAGSWLWGLDGLLARLPTAERDTLWAELFDLRQSPPLLLALPETFAALGPSDPDRWLQASPARGLRL